MGRRIARWRHTIRVCSQRRPHGMFTTAPVASPAAGSKSSMDMSITAIAAAALASAGVSVEQIVEPFAMVGPYLDNSLEMVKDFQGWWETALAASGIAENCNRCNSG